MMFFFVMESSGGLEKISMVIEWQIGTTSFQKGDHRADYVYFVGVFILQEEG